MRRPLLVVLAFLLLPLSIGAQQNQNGCVSGYTPGFVTCLDGSYTHVDLTSNQTNTGPNGLSFMGSFTPGDVVGFDYSFTFNGAAYNRQYRHTVTAGDTQVSLLNDLGGQWKADPIVVSAIGADIVSYALVRQFGPNSWAFQFYENWPFVNTGSPRLTFYASPGATLTGAGSAGSTVLEANPYYTCGRTTIAAGRQPQPGDRLCDFVITGDVTGKILDQRNVNQIYAQDEHSIIDPTPGVFRAKRSIEVDTLDLDVQHLLINGQPAGPIGTQGPPGGNIAGSIVQSPALTVCADQTQTTVNCAYTRVYKLTGLSITGWRTIATLTPSNVSGSWGMSKVKVEMVTGTNAVGNGTFEGQGYISIASGAPLTGWIGAPVGAGAAAQFRMITLGNSVQVQIASPNGSNYIASGFAKVEYMLSDAEGNPVTWTIQ